MLNLEKFKEKYFFKSIEKTNDKTKEKFIVKEPTGLAERALRKWGIPKRHWGEYGNYLNVIAEFLYHLNAIGHYDDVVDSREFDKILIPDEFKSLLYPKGIYVNPLLQPSKDLLRRQNDASLDKLEDKYQSFREACENWRYKSPSDFQVDGHFTKLSDIKQEVSLSSIESRIAVKKNNNWVVDFNGSDGFIPVPVIQSVKDLYYDNRYNDDSKYAIDEFINNFNF